MNDAMPQRPQSPVPEGILAATESRAAAVFYFCNARPGAAVIGQLLDAAVSRSGRRALVLTRSAAAAETLSKGLWSYRRNSFLPHGTDGPNAWRQPALITPTPVNANGASVLVLPDGETLRSFAPDAPLGIGGDFLTGFNLLLILVDARNEASMRGAAQSWADARTIGYETYAFGREIPPAARKTASASAASDFDSPVPLRWHRLA